MSRGALKFRAPFLLGSLRDEVRHPETEEIARMVFDERTETSGKVQTTRRQAFEPLMNTNKR